jgi:hypothetical protein
MNTMSTGEVQIAVGDRVRLTQQIPHGTSCWTTSIEGRVLNVTQEKTGAWYCHSKDEKLWLDRIVIRQDNGECSSCILDRFSRLDITAVHAAVVPVDADADALSRRALAEWATDGGPSAPEMASR